MQKNNTATEATSSDVPSEGPCVFVCFFLLFVDVFRTLSTVIGWIRNLLRREQKVTDFLPETDEMQMFSPVIHHKTILSSCVIPSSAHPALHRCRLARKSPSTWRVSCSMCDRDWTERTSTRRFGSSASAFIALCSTTCNSTSTVPWVKYHLCIV